MDTYEYEYDSEKSHFFFTTDSDIIYQIKIEGETGYFGDLKSTNDTYSFSFQPLNKADGSKKYDPKVNTTISTILHEWFLKNNKIICYMCSIEDDQACARQELFRKWHSTFNKLSINFGFSYEYKPQIIKSSDANYYAAVLHRNDYLNKSILDNDLIITKTKLETLK